LDLDDMHDAKTSFVLGSRSPRRLELLGRIVPPKWIEVLAPRSADELSFDGLHDRAAIDARLREIALGKWDDVAEQIRLRGRGEATTPAPVIVAADTIIVAEDASGRPIVLGQPPADDPDWPETVRRWFREFYAGRSHRAATALCVGRAGERPLQRIVDSQVTFHADVDRYLDWYLATHEPLGKAGGYALQGAGSLFVSHVEGSLSNVVGLPLRELWDMLDELGVASA
jgi:septum formation protein